MTIKDLQKLVHQIAINKGWWEEDCPFCNGTGKIIHTSDDCLHCNNGKIRIDRNDGELIALIHSELSEVLQELRKQDCDYNKVGIEMADVVIRILDYCEARDINLQKEIFKKIEINKKRPYRHGNKKF